MLIANNATPMLFVTDYNKQNSRLQTSMAKLSSGQRMIMPGEAPADLGISERFRAQIRNSGEAGRVIQNATNMLTSTDGWLQQVNDILNRMSELAISASDGSKNQQDRKNLDLEYQQLKSEVKRISEAGKYNGMQVNGRTGVAVWDAVDNTIVYSQYDGTEQREVKLNLDNGNSSANGIEYLFEGTSAAPNIGNFIFTADGKNLIYMNQTTSTTNTNTFQTSNKFIMKLELESNTLTSVSTGAGNSATGQSFNTRSNFRMDDQGRIWVGTGGGAGVATGANGFVVKLLDTEAMSLDSGGGAATNSWAGGVTTASGFGDFAVHQDHIYYFRNTSPATTNGVYEYVKQNLFDTADVQVLISDVETTIGLSDNNDATGTALGIDMYTISNDGQYIAFRDLDATVATSNSANIVVVNAMTQETASTSIGTTGAGTNNANQADLLVTSLDFDANNNLYWTSTGSVNFENSIRRAEITAGDTPEITNITTLRDENNGHFGFLDTTSARTGGGLSVRGGTPASNFLFQVGPDSGMTMAVESADLSLTRMGLSGTDVLSIERAQDAIKAVAGAVDMVTNQRAVIGSQVSRLNFTFAANATYFDNISQAESRIRDVDFASESSNLASAQIMAQASASILSQANASRGVVLQLLQ